jgi:hypothetical protein
MPPLPSKTLLQPYNLGNTTTREELSWMPRSPAQAMPKYLEWIQQQQQQRHSKL